MRRPTWLATSLVLALLLGGAACSDDAPPPSADSRSTTTAAPRTSTSSTTTTTTKPATGYVKAKVDPSLPRQDIDINLRYPASFTPAQVEVVQAWANFEHVFFLTADPPDPGSPLMDRYMTTDLAGTTRKQRSDLAADGLLARIPKDGSYSETAVSATVSTDSASLIVCVVDSSQQIDAKSGAVANGDVITKKLAVDFARAGERWLPDRGGRELARWSGREANQCLE
jgi:hypothetical protein